MIATQEGCIRCGSTTSKPLKTKEKERAYWIAKGKGDTEFRFLMSNLCYSFVYCCLEKIPAREKHPKFDWYCTDCFKELSKREDDDLEGEEWKK